MIISASRIVTASGSATVGAHVFSGPKNRSITLVQGSRAELDDMVRDARDHGAKYSIRHFKVNPEEATTREEALAVVAALGREFGFDPGRAVTVEHEKRRQGGAGFERHWHVMVPEVDPVRGRVLDASWMRARQEKVSRVAEIELAHHQVRGKWNRAVQAALRAEGRNELADRVHPLAAGDRPAEAFSAVRHQVAERCGRSMPQMKAAVTDAWQQSDSGSSFRAALVEQGLAARPGDKKGVWLVEATGADGAPVLVGSLARLTRAKAEEVGARMAEPVLAGAPAPPAEPSVAPVAEEAPPVAPPLSIETAAAQVAPSVVEVSAQVQEPAQAERAPAGTGSAVLSFEASAAADANAPAAAGGGGAPARPLEPTRPGDWLRVLNEATEATNRQPAVADRSSNEPAASDDPNRIGQIVGAGLPHPLQISAAPTGGATTDAGIIAAVDPTKPGDAARFLRETSSAQARRMAAVVSARSHKHTGDVHALHQHQPIQKQHALQEFGNTVVAAQHRRAGPEAQAVVDRGPTKRPAGDLGSAAGPGGRSEGIVDGHVRRDVGRGDVGSPAALARPAGASGGWRDVEDRRRDRLAGADRRQPGEDRGEAGRDRVDAYQIEIGLAARPDALARLRALTRVLSAPNAGSEADQAVPPPERSAVLEYALAMSNGRTAKLLAEEPWPNPRDRDPKALSLVAQKTIEDAVRDAEGRALAARDRHDDAERRLGVMDRLIGKMGIGRQTEAVLAIRTMAAEAEQLRMAADTLSSSHRDHLDRAAARAADLARKRQAERKRWTESGPVVRAMRERRGNDLVWRAIYAGDVDVQDLAERDLRAARDLLLRREQDSYNTTHVSAVGCTLRIGSGGNQVE